MQEVEPYFRSPDVSSFLIILQEATRARPDGQASVYIPPVNAEKAAADYHHLIFGQRGSGKSTLLRKLQSERIARGQVAAWVDQEVFANLSFPDVLVSSVETVIAGVHNTVLSHLDSTRAQQPWWRRVFLRRSKEDADLLDGLAAVQENLRRLKFAPLESSIEWTRAHSARTSAEVVGTVSVKQSGVKSSVGSASEETVQSRETVVSSKGEFLERALPDLKGLLSRAAEATGGGVVLVDDVYHLNPPDQPQVLGYLHRLIKDTGYWLKIGSIRYLTQTYTAEKRPTGMQAGHDAHLIALDDGMQRLQVSSGWLQDIIRQLATKADVSVDELFSPSSLDRMALASGCIARDYLTIAGAAIEEARNRPATTKSGMHRVTVEDVNRAAGVLAPAKLDDMQKDAPDEAAQLRVLINQLTDFCRRTRRAYFLVDASDRVLIDRMELLRHLRFVHLLERSETVKSVTTQRYDVWLLDVSQLAAQRATQQMDFSGWQDREKRRSGALIFEGRHADSTPARPKAVPDPPSVGRPEDSSETLF